MTEAVAGDGVVTKRKNRLVIGAASAGTVVEWYDFYLYGSLAGFITQHFFSGVNETTGYIFALLAFAAGFAVRPFGAIVFGLQYFGVVHLVIRGTNVSYGLVAMGLGAVLLVFDLVTKKKDEEPPA